MPSVTFIYVMSNIAYFAVLTPSEIVVSDAVAVVSTVKPVQGVYGTGKQRNWLSFFPDREFKDFNKNAGKTQQIWTKGGKINNF